MTHNAHFLWVGSLLPDQARVSVLSAAEAGFETTLFIDRTQDLEHANIRKVDWREVQLPWAPDEVRLKGSDRPCYAAFSDLFRFALLSKNDGWWFDCDTIILREAYQFAELLRPNMLTVGRESDQTLNGAVLGSLGQSQAQFLYDMAIEQFPLLEKWGVVGPALISSAIKSGEVNAHVLGEKFFYPIHHSEIADVYLPSRAKALKQDENNWYCLSLWGEVLSRSGLSYLKPPTSSYLADLLSRHGNFGPINGDPERLAIYLAENLKRLDHEDSGRLAMKTLVRKVKARILRGVGSRG